MTDDKASGSPRDSDRRRWALLVSSLVTASDSELETFRRRRGVDPSLDIERLKLARAYLERIGDALAANTPKQWDPLGAAAATLGLTIAPVVPPRGAAATPTAGVDATVDTAPAAPRSPREGGAAAGPQPPPLLMNDGPPLASATSEPLPLPASALTSPWVKASAPAAGARPVAPPPRPGLTPPPGPVGLPRPPIALPATVPTPAPPPVVSAAPLAVGDHEALTSLLANNPRLAAFAAAVAESGDDGGGATVVVSGTHDGRPVLPFQREPPPSSQGAAPELGPVVGDDAEQTLAFESPEMREQLASLRAAATGVLPPHLAALPIDRYAALVAQCRVYPEWQASIEQSFGVNGSVERSVLDDYWQQQFAADAKLEHTFRWQRDQHEQWERERQR
ncbi:MAG: hypothetical protein FJ096_14040 [Deltaproteobacteria bacterium]|nr:hypothetical protein [Deltaproteobacteria bacterium]